MSTKSTMFMAAGVMLGAIQFAAASTWNTHDPLSTSGTPGSWSDASKWTGGVPDGTAATADFSTLDVTVKQWVTLSNTPRTVNELVFGDTIVPTNAPDAWEILSGGAGGILTLGGDSPTIKVSGPSFDGRLLAVLNLTVAGTNGLIFNGNGTTGSNYQGQNTVRLRNANTYSGGTTVNSGTLQAANASSFGAASGNVTINGGVVQLAAANTTYVNDLFVLNGGVLFTTQNSTVKAVNVTANSIVSQFANAKLTLGSVGGVNLGTSILTLDNPSADNRTIEIPSLTGGAASGITKKAGTDVGTLILLGNNTGYAGTTKIDRGVLQVGHNGALGTGTLQFATSGSDDAQIRSTDATDRTIANVVSGIAGTANRTFGAAGTGNLTFTNTNNINLAGTDVRKLVTHNVITFAQGFTGAGGINVNPTAGAGVGTLVINGDSSYTGVTTIDKGTLRVNGSHTGGGAYTVGAAATLGGDGSTASAVTVNGKLAPGNSIGSLGVSATSFASGSSFDVELGAGASDLLAVTGNLTLGSGVTLNLSGLADDVTSYTIATYTGSLLGSGVFSTINGLPDGYTIDYGTGTNSAITLAVPEPASMTLLAGGLMMLTRRRRA